MTEDLTFYWELLEGGGLLEGTTNQEAQFRAPGVPGLSRLQVTVSQRDAHVSAEALVTVTDSLESAARAARLHLRAGGGGALALSI